MQKTLLQRSRSEWLFLALAVAILIILPFSLWSSSGILLALVGLLITWAAMLRPSFRNLSIAGKIAAMIGFAILTFWLIWIPITHHDAVDILQSGNSNLTSFSPSNIASTQDLRTLMANPDMAPKAVNEFWIRRLLPPILPSPCYMGDPEICAAIDGLNNQSYQNRWDDNLYFLAVISCLIPALGSALIVAYFKRSTAGQMAQNIEPITDPGSVS
jgi:hypothetical protein